MRLKFTLGVITVLVAILGFSNSAFANDNGIGQNGCTSGKPYEVDLTAGGSPVGTQTSSLG